MTIFLDDDYETIEPQSSGTPTSSTENFDAIQLNEIFGRSSDGANVGFKQIARPQRDRIKQKYNIDLQATDYDDYDKLLDENYQPTIANPMSLARTGIDTGLPDAIKDFKERQQIFLNENKILEELKAKDPTIETYRDIDARVKMLAKSVEDDAASVASRSVGLSPIAARFAGGMSGAVNPITNPLNFAALPLGGGGKTALARMKSAALYGAGVEAINQTLLVPENRAKLDLEQTTIAEKAFDILTAGAAEGAFQGVVDGVKYGVGKFKSNQQKYRPTNQQVLDVFAQLESGGNDSAYNQASGATGRYQITRETWDLVNKKYPELGFTDADIKNPKAQDKVAEVLLEDNNKIVARSVGRELSLGEKYITHFAGAGQATKLIKNATSNEPASIAFTPEAIKDNPAIFYKDAAKTELRTASEVYNLLTEKANNQWLKMGGKVERRSTTNTKRLLHDVRAKLNMDNPVNREIERQLSNNILFEEDINPHSVLTPEGRAHIKDLDAHEEMLMRDADAPLPIMPERPMASKEWLSAARLETMRNQAIERLIPESETILNAVKSAKTQAPKTTRLSALIKARGGIAEYNGELASRGITAKTFVGGVRKENVDFNSQENLSKSIDKKITSVDGNDGNLAYAIENGFLPEGSSHSDFYDALAKDLFNEPAYNQADKTAMRQYDDDVRAANPYADYFDVKKSDTPQTIAQKIYDFNKERQIYTLESKISELESQLTTAFENRGLNSEEAAQAAKTNIAMVRSLFETYLTRYGDAGLQRAILEELDKLQVEYNGEAIRNNAGDNTFFQATRADLGLSSDFNEADYRPSVINWAKNKFGERTAPDGSLAWQNFTQWFGDSKVVNDKGEPLVVYHGTQSNFEAFDVTKFQAGNVEGVYFTPDNQSIWLTDKTQGEKNIISAFVNIKNPASYSDFERISKINDDPSYGRIEMQKEGFDGYIDNETYNEIVAFTPAQIKSVFNKGAFSPNDARILYQGEKIFNDATPLDFSKESDGEQRVAEFEKWLKHNKDGNIVLYHGTSPSLPIEKEGLKKTSASRRKSYQSTGGYVYLASTPEQAKMFGDLGNMSNSVTYAVRVPVRDLLPDLDQIANLKSTGKQTKNTLAYSLVYGGGARVKRNIERYDVKKLNEPATLYQRGKKQTPNNSTLSLEGFEPISQRELIERKMQGGSKAKVTQKGMQGETNLFDQSELKQDTLFQRVWHGSPYRNIEKTGFKLDKIGSGEGAQAYGWGLYFTKNKEIAENYKQSISLQKIKINNKEYKPRTNFAKENYDEIIDILSIAYQQHDGDIAKIKSDFFAKAAYEMQTAKNGVYIEAYKAIKDAKEISAPKGQLYEAEIPEDGVMLLWDKPLNVQQSILKALRQPQAQQALADTDIGFEIFKQTGNELYTKIALSKTPKETSLLLNELGIKGIKYLDGSSRNAGEGSYNYVVFDDTAIDVINTYYQQSQTQLDAEFSPITKGSITFNPDSTIINLTPNADASTFIHEMGHFVFRMHERLANHPDAPAELKADYEAMRREVNANDGERLSVEQEEDLARKFEAYLRSGIAPNPELKSLFNTMRDWLLNVYQKFKDLNVSLSDDIIDVFDRIFTSSLDEQYQEWQYRYEPIAPNSPLPAASNIDLTRIEAMQEIDNDDAYYDQLMEDFAAIENAESFSMEIDGAAKTHATLVEEMQNDQIIKQITSECIL